MLVLSALATLSGFTALTFAFDEEPGEYRWVLRSIGRNLLELRVLAFAQRLAHPADEDGRLLLVTHCRPASYARAVHAAAGALLERHGEAGYQEIWAQHAFPAHALHLLARALDQPGHAA